MFNDPFITQPYCAHFPSVQDQVFHSFSVGQQVIMFIQNPFLLTDLLGSSKEVTLDAVGWLPSTFALKSSLLERILACSGSKKHLPRQRK